MSTRGHIRRSPRLVLYGIAFRVLGELAMRAGDGAARPGPGPLSGRQERRPVRAQPAVRADADVQG